MIPLATFAWRALVWVAAAALPLETLPAAPCSCASASRSVASSASSHSCCAARRHRHRDAATRATLRCDCDGGCLCQSSGESSTPSPVAKETRSHTVSLWAPVVVAPLPIVGESQEHVAARFLDFSTPAPERCATLCRFVL